MIVFAACDSQLAPRIVAAVDWCFISLKGSCARRSGSSSQGCALFQGSKVAYGLCLSQLLLLHELL